MCLHLLVLPLSIPFHFISFCCCFCIIIRLMFGLCLYYLLSHCNIIIVCVCVSVRVFFFSNRIFIISSLKLCVRLNDGDEMRISSACVFKYGIRINIHAWLWLVFFIFRHLHLSQRQIMIFDLFSIAQKPYARTTCECIISWDFTHNYQHLSQFQLIHSLSSSSSWTAMPYIRKEVLDCLSFGFFFLVGKIIVHFIIEILLKNETFENEFHRSELYSYLGWIFRSKNSSQQ